MNDFMKKHMKIENFFTERPKAVNVITGYKIIIEYTDKHTGSYKIAYVQ